MGLYDEIKKEVKKSSKNQNKPEIDNTITSPKHNCKMIHKEKVKPNRDFKFAEAMIYASAIYSFTRFKDSIDSENDLYNLMIDYNDIKVPVYIDSKNNIYIFIESKLIMDIKTINTLRVDLPKYIKEKYKDDIDKVYTVEEFKKEYYIIEWEY